MTTIDDSLARPTAAAPGAGDPGAATLDRIAAAAPALDAAPAFPAEAFVALARDGALALTVAGDVPREREWRAVRAVAGADGSVGRLYEGHLNAVERIAVAAPSMFRDTALAQVGDGTLWLGVWGADPAPDEGAPATLVPDGDGWRLEGAKVFCSGAGGLGGALVTARHPDGGPPRLAYVEPAGADVEIDRTWFRAGGMRASESHRVVFHGARVAALLGGPGELVREPWFSRDAIRTAAAWAGIADAAARAALDALAARAGDDLTALAAGRIASYTGTIDRWLEGAAARADATPADGMGRLAVELRVALADAARDLLDCAARACGSRPFATGGALDRARRDLEVFTLQHRLDPQLVRHGRALLEERR